MKLKVGFKLLILFLLCLNTKRLMAQMDVPIDKGIIKGDFTITFIDTNVVIKPNEFFYLSKLGLKANTSRGYLWYDAWLDDIVKQKGQYSFKKKPSYKIKITRPNDDKDYLGIIMFFNTNKKHADEAVSKYYEIKLSEEQFDQARNGNRGRSVYSYEYWQASFDKSDDGKALTWIIWLTGVSASK